MTRRARRFLALAGLAAFAASAGGCGAGPNVRAARSYTAPAAPEVRFPEYNPHAPRGEANATWRPTVASRDGNLVRPFEPSSQGDRPNYEGAPWATGATAGSARAAAPAGTF